MKATDVVEEEYNGQSPRHERVELCLGIEPAIVVEVGLDGAHGELDGAMQG